jgi:hypothetical protein
VRLTNRLQHDTRERQPAQFACNRSVVAQKNAVEESGTAFAVRDDLRRLVHHEQRQACTGALRAQHEHWLWVDALARVHDSEPAAAEFREPWQLALDTRTKGERLGHYGESLSGPDLNALTRAAVLLRRPPRRERLALANSL